MNHRNAWEIHRCIDLCNVQCVSVYKWNKLFYVFFFKVSNYRLAVKSARPAVKEINMNTGTSVFDMPFASFIFLQ